MATHDYVIDNSTGANVRADINNVLQAILTNNSSSSAPSTTAAYMWWADTTNGVLKIRNSSNNAWVELFQLDGTLTLEDGSASTPALAFRDDLNTGIFSSGEDVFNIATAGVEKLRISNSEIIFNEDGNNVDFRVESDTQTHMLFVDAGNNRVGINKSNPASELDVVGKFTVSGSANVNTVEIFGDTTTGQSFGLLVDAGTNTADYVANFRQANNNAALFIRGDGHIGMGTTNPGTPIEIRQTNANHSIIAVNRPNSDTFCVALGNNSSNNGIISVNNSHLLFGRDSSGTFSERLRMLNDGGLTFGGETSASHALDDYEEGGWSGLLNGGNFTATQQYFRYTKVGRMVLISGELSSFSSNSNSSNIEMTGAPFATESNCSHIGAINTTKLNKYSGYTNPQAARIEEGTTRVVFMYGGENGNTRFAVRYGDLNDTSAVIQFTIPYMTA